MRADRCCYCNDEFGINADRWRVITQEKKFMKRETIGYACELCNHLKLEYKLWGGDKLNEQIKMHICE